MKSLNPAFHASYRIFIVVAVMLTTHCETAISQATKPAQQPLYLPDPTPRPPDLERQYGGDPAALARQQELAALRSAQLRQQVIVATDKLLTLTQQLKADMEKREAAVPMVSQAGKVEQIEKLAKTVKEKTKWQ